MLDRYGIFAMDEVSYLLLLWC